MFENEPDLPFTHRGIRILFIISILIIGLSIAYKNREYLSNLTSKENKPKANIETRSDDLDIDKNALDYSLDINKKTINRDQVQVIRKPEISAESYLLGNLKTGEIYIDLNSDKIFPIASISKLIVSLVATHNIDINKKVVINEEMLKAYGNAGGLILGETYTVGELLFPLLLESSNDAAEAIAHSYPGGYNAFIYQMNAFVAELGMKNTSFKDASGLSPQNASNSEDLFTLAKYLYANEQNILKITRNNVYFIASSTDHAAHIYKSIDPFVLDPNFIGGKTGRTIEAKESMISLFNYISGKGNILPVAVIVLRSDLSQREIDTSVLFEKFMTKNPLN